MIIKTEICLQKCLKDFLPEENALEVLDGGVQSTVQDADGMIGYWTVGVPPCGAMDAYSFKIGNKLLGNDLNAAGIELTMRGGTYRFRTTASFLYNRCGYAGNA